jgi:hypothetical protein
MALPVVPILIIGLAALVMGGRRKPGVKNGGPSPDVPSESDAIDTAVKQGGTIDQMTNRAYWASHPECPHKLDPADPTHAECIAIWSRLRDRVKQKADGKKPGPTAETCDVDQIRPRTVDGKKQMWMCIGQVWQPIKKILPAHFYTVVEGHKTASTKTPAGEEPSGVEVILEYMGPQPFDREGWATVATLLAAAPFADHGYSVCASGPMPGSLVLTRRDGEKVDSVELNLNQPASLISHDALMALNEWS